MKLPESLLSQLAAMPPEAKRDIAAALDQVILARRAGLDPHWYQAAVLRSQAKRMILNWPRQAGKSTVTSVLPIHTAHYQPGSLTIITAPGLRQAALLLKKCKRALEAIGSDVTEAEKKNMLSLVMMNGSEIVAIPGSKGDTVRGYSSVDLLIIDEASRADDELANAVRPMVAASEGGRMVMLSTPNGKRGVFYDAWSSPGDLWERHALTWQQVPHYAPGFIEAERSDPSVPAQLFSQEYECLFLDTLNAIFPMELIERALSTEVAPMSFGSLGTSSLLSADIAPLPTF